MSETKESGGCAERRPDVLQQKVDDLRISLAQAEAEVSKLRLSLSSAEQVVEAARPFTYWSGQRPSLEQRALVLRNSLRIHDERKREVRHCPECGGEVKPTAKKGRTRVVIRGIHAPIPDDYKIPTCSNCGEEFMSLNVSEPLDLLLYPVAVAEMEGRIASLRVMLKERDNLLLRWRELTDTLGAPSDEEAIHRHVEWHRQAIRKLGEVERELHKERATIERSEKWHGFRQCGCGQAWKPAVGLYGTTEETECPACVLRRLHSECKREERVVAAARRIVAASYNRLATETESVLLWRELREALRAHDAQDSSGSGAASGGTATRKDAAAVPEGASVWTPSDAPEPAGDYVTLFARRAIPFLRSAFYDDGAEGESVHLLCKSHEALEAKVESLRLNTLGATAHEIARSKGFYDTPPSIPERLALIHSEVSEALEDYREGRMDLTTREDGKPEGFPSELADVLIRVLDLAAHLDIDIDLAVKTKMSHNATRLFMHGGKKL